MDDGLSALLDTSVLIARRAELSSPIPDRAAISVITLGELRAGVRLARDDAARGVRQARLAAVRSAYAPLPVDEDVADHYGEALARAREERRATKATDLLIVATAAATGRRLFTLDRAQSALAGALGVALA